jgi:hypothetical protein
MEGAEQIIHSVLAHGVTDHLTGAGNHFDEQTQLCEQSLFLALLLDEELGQSLALHGHSS